MAKLTNITISAIAQIVILVAIMNTAIADQNFNASMRLIGSQLSVTEEQDLQFGEFLIGQNQTIITNAADQNAAIFSAVGIANAQVTASIAENQIVMTTGAGNTVDNQIIVKGFENGGSLNRQGRAQFDYQGQLKDMRIGARAIIKSTNTAGDYAGSATFRIVYR